MANRPMSGIALAAQDAPEHAAAIEAMKEQLILVLLNRLGGSADIPVSEIDGTGGFVMLMKLNADRKSFHFEVRKKQ